MNAWKAVAIAGIWGATACMVIYSDVGVFVLPFAFLATMVIS